MTLKTLPDIPVWSVPTTGVKNSGKAFALLESKLTSLRARKFYGLLYGDTEFGIYRACVERGDYEIRDTKSLELWSIPGGKYATEKMKNWVNNIEMIGKTFEQLAHMIEIDESRPQIEFYRSQKELIVMVPVN